ncbi:MAG: hypothetical protein CL429_02605 [Acidimicrobiaceae bacterium]|nr:hypothetical protein [Acidimicrobiaceae bacterium]
MINEQIKRGMDEVKQNQIDAEECQQTRHELSEKNANNREQTTINNDTNRESRWRKRYWGAALAALIMVIGATWFATNYVTHHHGTRLYNDQKSTTELMESNKDMLDSIQKQQALIADLSHQVEQKTIKQVWFDRRREHSNEGFQKTAEKYPAGFEVWDGEKLIERWHWRIGGEPKTDQFGEYILRCVATYDEQGEYSGFTQSVMSHYPTDISGETGFYRNNRKDNSLSFILNLVENTFELTSEDMGIKWEQGDLKYSYLTNSGFKHSWSVNGAKGGKTRELSDIIKTLEHYKYLVHISSMFTFIDQQIIKPFDEINPEFAVQLESEKANQKIVLSHKEQNEISQSKLNCALAFMHDEPRYWDKVNIEHLNANWENEYATWIEKAPLMKQHLCNETTETAFSGGRITEPCTQLKVHNASIGGSSE